MTAADSYGSTIFCDDLREEVGGKKTFIGCYSESLLTTSFPLLLPIFALYIRFLEPLKDTSEVLLIRVFIENENGDEEALLDAELPSDRHQQVRNTGPSDEDADKLASVLQLRASPLVIQGPGFIRVRAYRGDEHFKLGSLRVARSDEAILSPLNEANITGKVVD